MATTETRMTTERLDAFMDAWNAHDVDAIVGFFAEDCVFHPSVGTELMGASYVGRDEVRRGVAAFFEIAGCFALWMALRREVTPQQAVVKAGWVVTPYGVPPRIQ